MFRIFGVAITNGNGTIKNVIEKEYRACVNNLSLAVFLYGDERDGVELQPDIKTLMHIHSYIEIFCCVSDGAAIMTHEGTVRLSYGDIVLIPVNYPHFSFGSNSSLLSLGFSGKRMDAKSTYNTYNLYSDFYDILELKKVRIYRTAADIYNMISSLKDEHHELSSPIPALEFLFVLRKLGDFDYTHISDDAESACGICGKEYDITRFLLLKQLISVNYTENYDANEIAKRLCITRRHMDRIIKEHYGKTLREIIYEKRIDYAKRLLLQSDATIDEIARTVGFSGSSVFKNAFVSKMGIMPSKYRIEQRKKK